MTRISAHHGLVMMSDYAEAIGGKTEIASFPGQGTTVCLSLLLSRPDSPVLASRSADVEQLSFPSAV